MPKREGHRLRAAGFIIAGALCGCSPQQTVPDQVAKGNDQTRAENVESPPRTPPFFPVNLVERPLLPASNAYGMIKVDKDCVVFVRGGGVYLPIWPKGSTIDWDDNNWVITFHGRSVRVGAEVSLPGGPFSLANRSEVRISGSIPTRCPQDTYAVG